MEHTTETPPSVEQPPKVGLTVLLGKIKFSNNSPSAPL